FWVEKHRRALLARKIDIQMQLIVLEADIPQMPNASGVIPRDKIVEEKSHAFDAEIANDETMRAIFSRRNIFAGVILSVPGGRERVTADGKLIDVRLAVENANEFPFRVVNAETDRAVERWRQKTDADASRFGWTRRGRW